MKLYLLRHGETVQNKSAIIQGQQPGDLSEQGIRQASLVAERLREHPFDIIFCSDLKRTRETLEPIMQHQSAEPIFREEIRERAFGVLEGEPASRLGELLKELNASKTNYRPEGGENFYDLKARADLFLSELFEEHNGKNVLVCSHGGTIRVMLATLLNRSVEHMANERIDNTSLSILEYAADSRKLIRSMVNDIAHLEAMTLAIDAAIDGTK